MSEQREPRVFHVTDSPPDDLRAVQDPFGRRWDRHPDDPESWIGSNPRRPSWTSGRQWQETFADMVRDRHTVTEIVDHEPER